MSTAHLKYKCRNCGKVFREEIARDGAIVVADIVEAINDGHLPRHPVVAEHLCGTNEVGFADLLSGEGY